MVGGFVARHIHVLTDAELDELEAVLEYPDVDLTEWLMGRRAVPDSHATPLLTRMLAETRGA